MNLLATTTWVFADGAYHYRKPNNPLCGLESAHLFINKGADAKGACRQNTISPLERAIQNDFFELADLLLEQGAELPQSLEYAESGKMARYLVDKGVPINGLIALQDVSKSYTQTTLIYHTSQEHLSVVKFLLKSTIDIYEIDDKNNTALHRALQHNPTSFLKSMMPYYDMKKCNDIKPLLQLDHYNRNSYELIKEALNDTKEEKSILNLTVLIKKESRPLVDELQHKLDKLREEILLQDPELDAKLPDYNTLLTQEDYDSLYGEFYKDIDQWEGENLQALYMEHAGSVTSPFDPYGMISGIKECDGSLNLGDTFEGMGDLTMEALFVGIEELLEENDELHSKINDYFHCAAYRAINIVLGNLVHDKKFSSLEWKKPFYFFAAEHDEEAKLIFVLK